MRSFPSQNKDLPQCTVVKAAAVSSLASLESCVFLVLGLKSDLESWCGRAGSVVWFVCLWRTLASL